MPTQKPALLAAMAVALAMQSLATAQDPVLENCELKYLDQVQLPATEAGVLRHLGVELGSYVTKDAVIARVDDQQALQQLKIAEAQRKAALAVYHDDIEKQYAEKAADVAKNNYDDLLEANSGSVEKVVTETELRGAKLEWERALLQIKKALKDKTLALYDYYVRDAEVDAAKQAIERRIVKAPFNGEVIRILKKQSEWVQPGDTILEFVRYDVLKVEGSVALKDYDPREVDGCEVTVTVEVGKAAQKSVKGRITYVEQQVQYEGDYRYVVQAEIPNTETDRHWVFLPGQQASMQIHLGTSQPRVSRRERAQ